MVAGAMLTVHVTVKTRVKEELAKATDEVAKEEGMDRSTVIRRFLSKAVRDWLIEKSLAAYGEGRLTLSQAAERCRLSLWETVEEARKRERSAYPTRFKSSGRT